LENCICPFVGTRIFLSHHFRFGCSFQDAFTSILKALKGQYTNDRTFYARNFTSPSKICVATLTSQAYLTFVGPVSIPSVGS